MSRRTLTALSPAVGSGVLLALVALAVVLARTHPIHRTDVSPLKTLAGVRPPDAAAGLDQGIAYSSTLAQLTTAPVAGLGTQWRSLGSVAGELTVSPRGVPSKYFALGLVAVALHAPGRFELTTSAGDSAVFPVLEGAADARVIRAGPFDATPGKPLIVRLTSRALTSEGSGPEMLISPIEAWYLKPGEALMRMPALQEQTHGITGYPIPANGLGSFAVTPGVRGQVDVKLTQISNSPGSPIEVSLAHVTRTIRAAPVGTEETVGPFPSSAGVVEVKLVAPVNERPPRWLLMRGLRAVTYHRPRRR